MRGIYLLEMEDDGSPEGVAVPKGMEVSLHAITGVATGNHTIAALVDPGSTHCFVAPDTAQQLGWLPQPRPGMTVGVAHASLAWVSVRDHLSASARKSSASTSTSSRWPVMRWFWAVSGYARSGPVL
jgi:hypothetical protein